MTAQEPEEVVGYINPTGSGEGNYVDMLDRSCPTCGATYTVREGHRCRPFFNLPTWVEQLPARRWPRWLPHAIGWAVVVGFVALLGWLEMLVSGAPR